MTSCRWLTNIGPSIGAVAGSWSLARLGGVGARSETGGAGLGGSSGAGGGGRGGTLDVSSSANATASAARRASSAAAAAARAAAASARAASSDSCTAAWVWNRRIDFSVCKMKWAWSCNTSVMMFVQLPSDERQPHKTRFKLLMCSQVETD